MNEFNNMDNFENNDTNDNSVENTHNDIEVQNTEVGTEATVETTVVEAEETTEVSDESYVVEEDKQRFQNKKGLPPIFAGFLGAMIGSATMLGGFLYVDSRGTAGNANNVAVTVNSVSQDDVTTMIQDARKSVVGITVFQTSVDDVLGSLLGESSGQSSSRATGSGSGIIYKVEDDRAFIVTNHHVVDGAQQIEITLDDGTSLSARLVGSDQWMDLAVLEVDGSSIKNVAALGDSDSIIAGQSVIAIGNPLGFLTGSVTQGVISSQERLIPVDVNGDGISDWEAQVIQTDAAINPGNSGGALLNADGEVIGINSSKIAGDAIEGIGFAIPINAAIPILEQLVQNGEVNRAQMGVQLVELSQVPAENRIATLNLPESVESGLVVISVSEGSAAARAGLQMYDVIVEIDRNQMDSMLTLRKYLFEEKEIGDTISITYYRNGEISTTSLTLDGAQN